MRKWVSEAPRWTWLVAGVVIVAAAATGVLFGRSQQPPSSQGEAAAEVPTGEVEWRKLELPLADLWMPFGSDGPANTTTGQWSGWTHTQQGAVQAGYMWLVCGALDNAAAADCVRARYSGALTEQWADVYANRSPVPREELVPVGFEVLAWTEDSARIVYRIKNGSTMIVGVSWDGQDWKILADSEESRPRNATQVAPGEKFELTPWGPSDG